MTRQTRPSSMLRCGDERGKRCDGRFPSVARSADSEAHAGTRRERRDGARGVRRDTHSERHRLRRRPRAGASGAPLKRVGALAEPADVEVKRADRRVRGRLGHFGDDEKACQHDANSRLEITSGHDAKRRVEPGRRAAARWRRPSPAPRGSRSCSFSSRRPAWRPRPRGGGARARATRRGRRATPSRRRASSRHDARARRRRAQTK